MNNNKELIEYKESFISKIRNFFKRFFGKQKKHYNYVQNEAITEIEQENQEIPSSFIDEIKFDSKIVSSILERNNFLVEIDGNEEALNMLSVDRLKKLEKYYDSVISKNEQTIRKLKATA